MGRTRGKTSRRRAGSPRKAPSAREETGAASGRGKHGKRRGDGNEVLVRSLRKTSGDLADWLSARRVEGPAARSECSDLSAEAGRLQELCARCAEAIEGRGRPASTPAGSSGEAADFWREKSIEELAREQGVKPVARLEDVLGRHADLWESDEDFEQFVNGICERRRREVAR